MEMKTKLLPSILLFSIAILIMFGSLYVTHRDTAPRYVLSALAVICLALGGVLLLRAGRRS